MSIKHMLVSALFASLLSTSTLAMDKDTLIQKYSAAKSNGLVGEQPNGYLGIIRVEGDVIIVTESINNFRKGRYQKVAQDNGLPLSEVETRAGQRLFEKAEPGHYLYINGKWVQK